MDFVICVHFVCLLSRRFGISLCGVEILMDLFVCSVWVARRPPGYAFIDFDDYRDAQDAIRELDGM